MKIYYYKKETPEGLIIGWECGEYGNYILIVGEDLSYDDTQEMLTLKQNAQQTLKAKNII